MSTPEAPLRAATYLGDNTIPIMGDLVGYLSEVTGVEVVVDDEAGKTTVEALRHAPTLDLVWMCGYPTVSLISTGRMSHAIVAAPVFAGHGGPFYHAVIVTHEAGPPSLGAALETRLAVNELESWSGFLGLMAHVERSFPGRWFADQVVTGSHRASLGTLADRTCDVASVDVTVWEHALAERPEAVAELRVIDRTVHWPAPPFSLGSQLHPRVRKGLITALLSVGPSDVPLLDGVVPANSEAYRDVMPVRSRGIPSSVILEARDADRK
ncbi:MAG: PhnD/SsuA/transferrin family substrate-binding protein [bacterium]|nr:PhnD/SsuA/transferrin family substrate-binding protein [bacterium]MDE0352831.1 PhnD/SsuA/transferrin family substrate-binding protein [bacterium]